MWKVLLSFVQNWKCPHSFSHVVYRYSLINNAWFLNYSCTLLAVTVWKEIFFAIKKGPICLLCSKYTLEKMSIIQFGSNSKHFKTGLWERLHCQKLSWMQNRTCRTSHQLRWHEFQTSENKKVWRSEQEMEKSYETDVLRYRKIHCSTEQMTLLL